MRRFSAEHIAVLVLTAVAIAVAAGRRERRRCGSWAASPSSSWPLYIAAAAALARGYLRC